MFIAISELPGFTSSQQWMLDDAEAMALLAAPCLSTLDPEVEADVPKLAAVKAILRGALLRWLEAGNGALTQKSETAGPFSLSESFDTRQQRRNMFWPSEVTQLQGICSSVASSGTAGTVPAGGTVHVPWCALMMGALYCSCGADIAGFPLFESADL